MKHYDNLEELGSPMSKVRSSTNKTQRTNNDSTEWIDHTRQRSDFVGDLDSVSTEIDCNLCIVANQEVVFI